MRKTVTYVLVTLVAVFSLYEIGNADIEFEAEFQDAVAEYFGVSRGDVQQTTEVGIPNRGLAVVFFIATETGVSRTRIADARLEGNSWYQIATSHGLTATNFYVLLSREVVGDQFRKTYDKFEGLKRAEFSKVELSDTDIVNLVNLKFLYRHYNYSQYLIMVWIAEGRNLVEINHLVLTITSEMRNRDSTKSD